MSATRSTQGLYDFQFGKYLEEGLQTFLDQFRPWTKIMLVAAAIMLAATACCYFPSWLVAGPLACGLHHCALLTIRGHPVDAAALQRGWKRAGTSMIAFLGLVAMQALPAVLLYGLAFGAQVAIMAFVGPSFGPGRSGAVDVATIVTLIVGSYGLMVLGYLGLMFWCIWFAARTMYVMPLIADRDCSFFEAFEESWRLTKVRTWEMVLLQLLAAIMGGVGFMACLVGGILTLPVYFTTMAAAYQRHALPQFTPPEIENGPPALLENSPAESPADGAA